MASRFFATFSLQDLIGNRLSSLSAPQCNASGSIGGSTGFISSGQSHYRRSESLSCPLHESSGVEFDKRELIESLMPALERAIMESGASIHTRGQIPGTFHSSEFFIEYIENGIQGRIILSGDGTGRTYRLRADIEEKGNDEASPFPMDAFNRIRPEGDYYVVAFEQGDPLAHDNKLHEIGIEFIKEARHRIPAGFSTEDAKRLQYAEVWTLFKIPQQMKKLMRLRGIEQNVDGADEYQKYETVYFLNEVALQMYEEGGIILKVLKKVSSAELPAGCSRNLRGPYIPK